MERFQRMVRPCGWLIQLMPALALLQACAGLPRVEAVPPQWTEQARVPGIPDARIWTDKEVETFAWEGYWATERQLEALHEVGGSTTTLPAENFLAISGGADDGPFAAGLLAGWSAAGTRPRFDMVTGVSAGALIAPFAFLGPQFDWALREVSTQTRPKDFFQSKNILSGYFGDGLSDSRPLAALIDRLVTKKVLADIAREYKKGRDVFVGTTDLDAGRPVVWDLGAIASSGAPGALELVRKILLASMSVPGLAPPVMIDVDAGGRRYQEMHVDGGVMAQVFLYPDRALELLRQLARPYADRERHAYVIRNGRLDPEWTSMRRRVSDIAWRSVEAMIHAQGINDLYSIYATTQRDRVDFNLAYIPSDFAAPHPTDFDPGYMRNLFEYAYGLGARGYYWHKSPPER